MIAKTGRSGTGNNYHGDQLKDNDNDNDKDKNKDNDKDQPIIMMVLKPALKNAVDDSDGANDDKHKKPPP